VVGKGRLEHTQPFLYSLDETVDVGCDTGTQVSDDYGHKDSAFTGALRWVRLEVGSDDHSHLRDPEHLSAIAMNRQ
jgi:arylsulfatase